MDGFASILAGDVLGDAVTPTKLPLRTNAAFIFFACGPRAEMLSMRIIALSEQNVCEPAHTTFL